MGFCYTVSGAHLTVANAAVTLVHIQPLATGLGSHIKIKRMWIGQDENATSIMQRINWGRKVTAFPTLTSATPVAHNSDAPTAGIHGGTDGAAGHCGVNASAEGAGGLTVIGTDAFNAITGWLWIPTPAEEIEVGPGKSFSLQFPVAPTTLAGWDFGLTFEEC
jgi:hypothetical protein